MQVVARDTWLDVVLWGVAINQNMYFNYFYNWIKAEIKS